MEDASVCRNIIAVISCSDSSHEEIIRGILSVEELSEPEQLEQDLFKYPWHIETKYYTADANVIAFKSMSADYIRHCSNVEAILIHFDSKKASSFEEVDKWLSFVSKCDAGVLLLSCENCADSQEEGVSRETVMNWCLKNHFELVELNPDEDEEDDFKEMEGYSRIIQALSAHTWPDLILKEPHSHKLKKKEPELYQEEEQEDLVSVAHVGSSSECAPVSGIENAANAVASQDMNKEIPQQSRVEKIDSLLNEDKWMFEAVGREDPGSEPFESLFHRILNMKEKAETLQGEERKLYAEKVAIEFWRAIGGDEDEIAGLNSDED